MLCMPMGRDQNDNAARIAWHGAGIRIDPASRATEIEPALRRLIDEPGYREQALALGKQVRAESHPHKAVDLIEALAERGCAGRA